MSDALGERELASLIREHTPQLFGVVRSFTADDDEAEDLLQEVWMTVAVQAHRRPSGAPLGAWLHTVALNRACSHFRKVRRRRWLLMRWSTALPPQHDETRAPSVREALERARLWRAVGNLPALQRDALLLRIVDGLSTREAAQQLGRAEGTVKASLFRALQNLRCQLDREADASSTDASND